MNALLLTVTVFLSLALPSLGGRVDPVYRCGGVGTFREFRVSDCQGRCNFIPGRVYNCELDFMPSSASPSLTLKVDVCVSSGFCHKIIDTPLPNSSIQPGFVYTSKYMIVPNDILSGQEIDFSAELSHTDRGIVEVCIYAYVDVGEIFLKK